MFVVGIALIAGSVIYYIWAVERLEDIGESGDEFLPELPIHGSDDFRLPPRQFSAEARQHETGKDNGTSALPNLQELQAALAQFAVKRG